MMTSSLDAKPPVYLLANGMSSLASDRQVVQVIGLPSMDYMTFKVACASGDSTGRTSARSAMFTFDSDGRLVNNKAADGSVSVIDDMSTRSTQRALEASNVEQVLLIPGQWQGVAKTRELQQRFAAELASPQTAFARIHAALSTKQQEFKRALSYAPSPVAVHVGEKFSNKLLHSQVGLDAPMWRVRFRLDSSVLQWDWLRLSVDETTGFVSGEVTARPAQKWYRVLVYADVITKLANVVTLELALAFTIEVATFFDADRRAWLTASAQPQQRELRVDASEGSARILQQVTRPQVLQQQSLYQVEFRAVDMPLPGFSIDAESGSIAGVVEEPLVECVVLRASATFKLLHIKEDPLVN
ncbi:MAG: hypothetical protein MHM6MM_005800 [Cercozoa sp. M6MM]